MADAHNSQRRRRRRLHNAADRWHPRGGNTYDLECVTPRPPAVVGPQWMKHGTWQHLLSVAANGCPVVHTVHQTDAVIGDFQERNILVADTTRVTLVDCDSMQFTDRDRRQFLCAVMGAVSVDIEAQIEDARGLTPRLAQAPIRSTRETRRPR